MERRSSVYKNEKEISKYKRDYAVAKQKLWEARMQLLDNIYVYNMGSHTIPLKVNSPVGGSRTETETETDGETETQRERQRQRQRQRQRGKARDIRSQTPTETTEAEGAERRRPIVVESREEAQSSQREMPAKTSYSQASVPSFYGERRENQNQQQVMQATAEEMPSVSEGKERARRKRNPNSNPNSSRQTRETRQGPRIGKRVGNLLGRGGMTLFRLTKWCVSTTLQTAEDVIVCSDILVSTTVGITRDILKRFRIAPGNKGDNYRGDQDQYSKSNAGGGRRANTGDLESKEGTTGSFSGGRSRALVRCAFYAVGLGLAFILYEALGMDEKRKTLPTNRVVVLKGEGKDKVAKSAQQAPPQGSKRGRSRFSELLVLPGVATRFASSS